LEPKPETKTSSNMRKTGVFKKYLCWQYWTERKIKNKIDVKEDVKKIKNKMWFYGYD
jgi:hypothetical protein